MSVNIQHILTDQEVHHQMLPVCKTAVDILDNCFQQNNCFSEEEINMARSVFATFYHFTIISMESFSAKSASYEKPVAYQLAAVIRKLAIEDYQVIFIYDELVSQN